ncbi:MAG: IS200/IS605 family accessory protein TnpB-related protein, partial [Conexivisphaerales archaeon]
LQIIYEHSTNQSNDFLHKLSHMLVNSVYTSFAVEGLLIQNMMKDHRLAGSIQDASWNRFIQLLSYKAESAGLRAEGESEKHVKGVQQLWQRSGHAAF